MVSVEAVMYVSGDYLWSNVDLLHGPTLSLHVSGIPLPIYGLTLHFLWPPSVF